MTHIKALFLALLLCAQTASAAPSLDEAKAALGELGGLAADTVDPDGSAFRLGLPATDIDAGTVVYLFKSGGGWNLAALPANGLRWTADDVLAGSGDLFGDTSFSPSVLLLATAEGTLSDDGWPAPLKNALSGYPLDVKAGVSAFMQLSPGSTGALGQLKTAIGLGNGGVRMSGSAGPGVLKKLLPKHKSGGGAPVALRLDLPSATPPVFAALGANAPYSVRFNSTQLNLTAQGNGFGLSGKQSVTVRILDKALDLDDTLSFNKAGASYQIACEGSVDADANLLGTEAIGFSVRKLFVSGDLASSRENGKKIKGFGLGVGALVDVSGAGGLKGSFDADIVNNKLTELSLSFSGETGALKLGNLPGIKELPGSDEFELSQFGLGVRPKDKQAFIFGGLNWTTRGVTAQSVILTGKKELALFFKGTGLSLKKLAPGIPAEMDVIPLDKAVVIISRGKLDNMAPSMLPSPVKAMIDEISGGTGNKVSFTDGLTVLTSFTPDGAIKEPMALLGMGGSPIVLAGAIGGVFRGDPNFAFSADLGSNPLSGNASPGFIKPRGAAPKFFIVARDLKSKPAMDLGVDAGVVLALGGDHLEMSLRTYATLGQAGAGVRATGRMDGDWNDPLGLRTVKISDLVLGMGLDADSTVTISMGGKLAFDRYKFDSAMTLGVLAATGTPKRLGLLFSGKELSPRVQLKLMDIFVRSAASGPLASALDEKDRANLQALASGPSFSEHAAKYIPIDLVAVKDFKAFLATPGASDPDLPGLAGTGVALKGTLLFNGKVAGKTDSYLTDIDGMKLKGSISDFSIPGFLSLKNAALDVRVPLPLAGIPYFKMKGESTTLLNKGALDIELGLEKLKFVSKSDWGAFGYANIHAESFGPSLLQPTDFILEMEGGADLKNGIRKQLAPAIDGLLAAASAEDQKRLKAAQAELADLKANYDAVKAKAGKNKANASEAIDDAAKSVKKWKGRFKDVKADIKEHKKDISKAKDKVQLDKAAKLGIELGALYVKKAAINASYKTAKGVLKAAKKVTGAVPVDLYPEVAAAKLAVDAKQVEIDEIKAGKAVNKDLQNVSAAIKNGAGKIPVAIEEFSFKNGSMRAALQGEPQLVTIKVKVTLPGKPGFRYTKQLPVNLLNPAAMDLAGLAEDIGDTIEELADPDDELPEGVELL